MWNVGDRVGVGCHGGHCHQCDRCRVGDFITCYNGGLIGASLCLRALLASVYGSTDVHLHSH